jgi:hypothetical protein
LQSSSKLVSAEDIDSDLESHESYCSIATVSTIVSEIHTAIGEVIDYEQRGPLDPAADAEPTFDDQAVWEGNFSGLYEYIQMQAVEEDAGSVRHNTSVQEVQDYNGNARLFDSGYAEDEPTTLSETTQSARMTEPMLGSASIHKFRSGIPRPKNVAGGPTALVVVALQTSPRTQPLAEGFGKSTENLRIFSKIKEIQTESAPSLHYTPPLHHSPPSHTLALHHLAATIYDPDRNVDSMMDLTRSLLPQYRNVLAPDKDGNTAGHIALSTPRKLYQPEYPILWWIITWLGNGNDGITCPNDKGETILHYAARNGYKSVVAELLRRGADPNAKNNAGRSVIQVCDGALNSANARVAIAQMTAPADYTLEWEARAAESARIADCSQLLRYHLG